MNKKLSILCVVLISVPLNAMDKKRKKLSAAEAFDLELAEQRLKQERNSAVTCAEEQLRTFCKSRTLEPVLTFLAASADINSYDRTTGMTALHHAASNGDYSLVQLLVKKGAQVNSTDFSRRTAVWYAAYYGHEEVVALLRTLGADVRATCHKGISALHAAAEQGHCACCTLLIGLGCPVAAATENGRTPLHFAAIHNYIQIAQELLNHGAPLHARTGGNHTPLHEAVRKGHKEMVQLLLDREPNTSSMAEELATAFYLALDYYQADDVDRLKVMEMLLNAGCDPNRRTHEGYTLLHFVIRSGHSAVARLLLAHHADPRIQTPQGTFLPAEYSPLKLAAKKGHNEMVRLLLEYQPDKDSLKDEMAAVLHMVLADCKDDDRGRLGIIEALLDAGCSPNKLSQEGYSPLQRAIWSGHAAIAELLVRRGADLSYRTPAGTAMPAEWTMLHLAAHKLLSGTCKLLVEKGLEPMALTPDGKQAIRIAFETNLPGSAALATALHTKHFQETPI